MYATALTRAGFNVTTASNGSEALQHVQNVLPNGDMPHFDIILLDMLMAGMSGLDFLRAYDVRTQSPTTKIVALTNIDNPNVEEKAFELGAVEYLNKSTYEPGQLINHIHELLSAPATPAPNTPSPAPTPPPPAAQATELPKPKS
jgi:CheY-like chemotaxis protein